MKFGYEFRRTTITLTQDAGFRGKLVLRRPEHISCAAAPCFRASMRPGDTRRHSFENSHGLYVQDSFRMTPRFTLNLGMRWDYFGIIGEKNNLFHRLEPGGRRDRNTVGHQRHFRPAL